MTDIILSKSMGIYFFSFLWLVHSNKTMFLAIVFNK